MNNRRKNTENHNETNSNKPIIKKGVLEIAKKLGVAIPTSLVLLLNINADATTQDPMSKDKVNAAKELNKLQTNETVKYLLDHNQVIKDNMILAQVHSNTHVNKNSPDIIRDGKHLNVHTNTHSDYTRY